MNIPLCRLANQHLTGKPFDTIEEAVDWIGAVQAQDYGGAKWGLGQRITGVNDRDLDLAYDEGRILRTHVLRPTWHFVLPRDIRWMLKLTAKRIHKVSAYYYRKCELSDSLIGRTNDVIARAVEGRNYKTRDELGAALRNHGIEFDALRLTYLVMCAELEAVVCSGPKRGKQFTYALLDERVGSRLTTDGDEALAMLARRYYQSHGPAQVQDLGNWASLSVADAKQATTLIQGELERFEQNGKTFWHFPGDEPSVPSKPVLHLLPNFDEHTIAYKDYEPQFDSDVYAVANSSGALERAHVLTRNGKVIGGWRRTMSKKRVDVQVIPIVELSKDDVLGIQLAADRYAQFLGVEEAVVTGVGV